MIASRKTKFESHPAFAGHALVTARNDRAARYSAIVAIHDDTRGPAIGGCRIRPYATEFDATMDVLRLSRGMTYKTAIADIPYGGGKAVILADPRRDKSPDLLHWFGDFVESLGGRYITSFDSGTTLDDLEIIATRTSYIAGHDRTNLDASESTADGVFACLKATVEQRLGAYDLAGLRVAVQGVGNVGEKLVRRLRSEGVHVWLCDVDANRASRVADENACQIAAPDDIHALDVDVFSPNALGGALNPRTISELRAVAVVGGANNQLASAEDDERLKDRSIAYCPDYLANAGGIINLHYQRNQGTAEQLAQHIDQLGSLCREILDRSGQECRPTGAITDAIAEQRIREAAKQ